MTPRVHIVIPVHNGIQHTLTLIRALTPLLHPADKIVVVDDGSTDGSGAILRAEHPEVSVLPGDGNLWWSGAINKGARFALDQGAEYVLFLNNDILLHPQFLEELLIGAKAHPRSLIASKILSADEPWRAWSMGGKVDWLRGKHWMRGCHQLDDGRWEKPVEADWLPGMSILVPMAVFRQGRWLDERAFPQYFGDTDFTMRVRRAGFKLIVWPKSRIYNRLHNSGLDTQLLLGVHRLTLRRFLQTFTSLKSSKACRIYGRWVTRHAPLWSWPMMFGRFYAHHLLKCLQIWLRLPSLRRTVRRHRGSIAAHAQNSAAPTEVDLQDEIC